ncbi:hypothetical protein SMICM304S_10789 [Streptomyces microflavus]
MDPGSTVNEPSGPAPAYASPRRTRWQRSPRAAASVAKASATPWVSARTSQPWSRAVMAAGASGSSSPGSGHSVQTVSASQESIVVRATAVAAFSTSAARNPWIRPSGAPSSAYRAMSPSVVSASAGRTVACTHSGWSPMGSRATSSSERGSLMPASGAGSPRSCGVSSAWKQASSRTGWRWWPEASTPSGGRIRARTSPAPIHTSSMARKAGP